MQDITTLSPAQLAGLAIQADHATKRKKVLDTLVTPNGATGSRTFLEAIALIQGLPVERESIELLLETYLSEEDAADAIIRGVDHLSDLLNALTHTFPEGRHIEYRFMFSADAPQSAYLVANLKDVPIARVAATLRITLKDGEFAGLSSLEARKQFLSWS